MPIKILVDGYNLLGALRGMGGPLEANREELVRLLAAYAAGRPHEVTVVFDAMHEGGIHETRDRRGAVTLVYTARGETADDRIVRMVEVRPGAAWLVVTSDRALAAAAKRRGADVVGAGTFAQRIAESMKSQGTPASEGREDEGEEVLPPREKKGNPRRLKKADRRLRLRLEKL
ncbi:MAG: NYN domain-containing protein [Nitrospirae bacterium]|nr:NYN domain-containing protein [Nitrospirota bacterium]